MIFIPADKINLLAPYRVKQVDDSVFAFTTKHGISYTASFVADVSFFDEGVYQFFLTKTSSRKGRKDDDISETVKARRFSFSLWEIGKPTLFIESSVFSVILSFLQNTLRFLAKYWDQIHSRERKLFPQNKDAHERNTSRRGQTEILSKASLQFQTSHPCNLVWAV